MGVFGPFARFFEKLDSYPTNFSFGFKNSAGYQTALGGVVSIIIYLATFILVTNILITYCINRNYASVTTAQKRGDMEEVNFSESHNSNVDFISLIMLYSRCTIYSKDLVYRVDRDCTIELAKRHVFFEINNYTSGFTSEQPERYPFSAGYQLDTCDEDYFDDNFWAYGTSSLDSDSSLDKELLRNITFCWKESQEKFRTSRYFQMIGEIRFKGITLEEFQELKKSKSDSLEQVKQDQLELIEQAENDSELSSEESAQRIEEINEYYEKIIGEYEEPEQFVFRKIIRQTKVVAINEIETGSPFEMETFDFPVYFVFDEDSGNYIMNKGTYTYWEFVWKNEEISSNYGINFLFRFTKTWSNVYCSVATMYRTMVYDDDHGFLFVVFWIDPYRNIVSIEYQDLTSVIGEIGGNIELIGWLSLIILGTKALSMNRRITNEYFLKNSKGEVQPYTLSLCESIYLVFQKIFPCVLKKKVRPVNFKGKRVEALEALDEIIDENLGLKDYLVLKRKMKLLEDHLISKNEREKMESQVFDITNYGKLDNAKFETSSENSPEKNQNRDMELENVLVENISE